MIPPIKSVQAVADRRSADRQIVPKPRKPGRDFAVILKQVLKIKKWELISSETIKVKPT